MGDSHSVLMVKLQTDKLFGRKKHEDNSTMDLGEREYQDIHWI
jgi:hypothetical protein